MQTLDMVNQNCELASIDSGFSKTEWEELGKAMENLKKFSDLYCTGCKYCEYVKKGRLFFLTISCGRINSLWRNI